ncbi:MAG: hypothetical protein U0R29_02060 [Solirubrobacterales bacterium]|nr:hypothetical protein [Solirubrobacterales bacterium]HNH85840.1 hypothetical protein [Solirubrobacterales bacterium]
MAVAPFNLKVPAVFSNVPNIGSSPAGEDCTAPGHKSGGHAGSQSTLGAAANRKDGPARRQKAILVLTMLDHRLGKARSEHLRSGHKPELLPRDPLE